jgi:hypothetical protein
MSEFFALGLADDPISVAGITSSVVFKRRICWILGLVAFPPAGGCRDSLQVLRLTMGACRESPWLMQIRENGMKLA